MKTFAPKKKKTASTVGIDIDTGSVAAAEWSDASGPLRGGVQALPEGAFRDGEVVDADAVAAALGELFGREGLSKRVRLAVASQKAAFRTLRLPLIEDPEQLKSAVRFQAQEQIPMPLDSAVLDHQVIGAHVTDDGNRQIDVAVVAARKEAIAALLDVARKAGLDPVGIDLAAFGMIRALGPNAVAPASASGGSGPDSAAEYVPATLYCNLGDLTNLAIARDYACLFSRVAQFGVRQIAADLAQSTDLPIEHAEQWLLHAGLDAPLEEIDGDATAAAAARSVLETGAGRLADELRLSLDYYGAQEGATPVGGIVLCGWGSAIPGLAARLGADLGREVAAPRPTPLAGMDLARAARLTLPYGISLEQ
jgi:type IV pilus assembly protein PilM